MILTLAMNTASPSLQTEAPGCYCGQKGLHLEGFSVICPLPAAALHPFVKRFETLSFLLAPACNELQTPPAAHTKEYPPGVEGIIKMPCFSSRPVFISKAPACGYLCMSIWSCSVPTGSFPSLVMSKSEAREEKDGNVVSVALQPGRTHWSLCLVPSAGGDDCSSKPAPQDWQSSLQVQVSLYGVLVPVPGEQDGWIFGLVMCKVFRASGVS